MRGFPILNLLIVVAFFCAAWWPLQRVIGGRDKELPAGGDEVDLAVVDAGGFILRGVSSHPLRSLVVTNAGEVLFTAREFEEGIVDPLEFEVVLGGMEVPKEGVEFWVEAVFLKEADDEERAVMTLELAPEDMDRKGKTFTLWGDAGEVEVAGPVFFTWLGGEE